MHTGGFGTALILRNWRVTLLNTPALEAERGRGQDLVQPGQLGSHDVIQVKDLPSLACHNEQLPLRNHEHAAWYAADRLLLRLPSGLRTR